MLADGLAPYLIPPAAVAAPFPSDATLDLLAKCESGNDPTDTAGLYYGAVQFSLGSWAAVGGRGLPSDAPLAEQYDRARRLYAIQGPAAWPVCSYAAGLR